MAKFKEYKIGPAQQVVINVSDYLPQNHLCKELEQIVFDLDTSVIEAKYSELGQNALHPKLMLCIIFLGYMEGIRSGRKLAKACQEQLPFIYLSKGYHPKKSCINDFRKENYPHFEDLFLQVLKRCQQLGLANASFSIIDGSKMEANSSKRRTKTKAKYEKWLNFLSEDIASLEQELSGQGSEKKKIAAKKRLHQKIEQAIERFSEEAPQKSINLTDPDGPILKGKKGNFDTNYNIQLACSEDQVITFNDVVTDGNDKARLIPDIQGIEANTSQKVDIILADADFGTFDSFEYMHKHNIRGYVPYRDMNATFEDKPYHKAHFIYDEQQDVYICPAKQALEFKSIRKDTKRNKQYRQYKTKACKTCPFKNQCCSSKRSPYRTILREVRQKLRDEMKRRLNSEEGKKIYLRRLHPIEAIFGHFKYNLGYTRFLLRGLDKVKAEFTLMCLAYNLGKIIKALLFLLFWCKSNTPCRAMLKNILSYPIFQRTCLEHLDNNYYVSTYNYLSTCILVDYFRSACMAIPAFLALSKPKKFILIYW